MDNTEGSRVISRVYKARKNMCIELTELQLSVVLGSIIGDAYIHPLGKICFEHGSGQMAYLQWKYSQLSTIAYPKIAQVTRYDKRNQKHTISYRFFLRQYFRPLRELFYKETIKVIPNDIVRYFNPVTIAVWYMDDGYLDKGTPLFMTDSYSQTDIRTLQEGFMSLGLKCSYASKNRLRISQYSKYQFFQMVEPWIHPSLRYKLP